MAQQPTQENYNDYKRAEKKALELLAEMKATTPNKVDIELSLLVSIFELHKDQMNPAHISKIVQGHLETLIPYYTDKRSNN